MTNSKENKPTKINVTLLAIVALFAIVLITQITINNINNRINIVSNTNTITNSNSDNVGQASEAIIETIPDLPLCKMIVSKTESYDTTNLITGLQVDSNTYYSGYNIAVTQINSNGCTINIDGNNDYITIGQIQKIGPLYVTIKGISE